VEKELNDKINICDECSSEYYRHSSKMASLCPECSHFIYGYENCDHQFENGRCIKCFWNGNSTKFIEEIKNKKPV
jgi:hypothetical protein